MCIYTYLYTCIYVYIFLYGIYITFVTKEHEFVVKNRKPEAQAQNEEK